MGVVYYVGCRKCKVSRDLDKLRIPVVASQAEARSASDQAEVHRYRTFLLASFMIEHQGHDCVMFNDTGYDDCFEQMPEAPERFW